MTWLALWFALQAGFMPNDLMVVYRPGIVSLDQQTEYVNLQGELRAFDNRVFLGGSIKTEMQQDGARANFMPESSTYLFTAGLRLGGVEIGYLHVCSHPVVPSYYLLNPVIGYDQGYDDFYIRFSGSVDLLKARP